MSNNQQVVRKLLQEKQKSLMTKLVKRASDNFGKQRFSKYLDSSQVTSGTSTDGSTGYSQIEGRFLGLQNRGYTPPSGARIEAKRANALRFTVGGRGTLVPNSLDSQAPIEGTTVLYRKSVKRGTIKAGRWDKANKRDVLEYLDTLL